MKRKVFFLLVMLSLASMTYAHSFSAVCSTGQWLYYNINGTNVTVTYPGNSGGYDGYTRPTGNLEIPSSVNYNDITYSVTSIGSAAFSGCSGLTSVTIPSSVTSIGQAAFSGCSGLTGTLTIPNSVTSIGSAAFSGCSGLTSVTIPSSVTSIGQAAFSGCSGLTGTLTIPNSVTSIGDAAFYGCSGLTSVTIPNSVTSIGDAAFYLVKNVVYDGPIAGCPWGGQTCNGYIEDSLIYSDASKTVVTGCVLGLRNAIIPNSVTSIGEFAFSGCTGLTSVTIPNSVTSIERYAFSGCSGLTSVIIPNSMTSIEEGTFFGCTGLTSVTIPNSVTGIETWAFYCCSGLTSVTIPNSVTSIGSAAFYGCIGLTSVTIPNSVTSIGEDAFNGCTGLTSVTIGRSVNQIGTNAFSGCPNLAIVVYRAESCVNQSYSALFGTALTSLSFGNYVRVIPDYAFSDCSELTSVTIPNSVTRIGGAAFQNCSGLTSVAIGNSVTIIDGGAFYGCSGLTGTLTIPNSVTEIGYNAFSGCSGLNAVTIGKSVTRIQGTFVGCTSLSTLNFNAENCRNVTEGVFQNLTRLTTLNIGNEVQYIPTNMFNGCTGLVNLNIPDAVEEIGTGAFAGCSNLTSATIGNGVATIGSNAFANCIRLTSVSLGSSVETIGNSAFSNCGIIGELVVPQSVISIGDAGFYHCYGISEITCLGRVAPTLGTDAFEGVVSSIPVNVPCGTTNIYAGRWPYFSNFNSTPFVFHVASADLAMGTVSMTQSPSCNDPVAIVVATPRSGYQFDHWSDGSTANPYTYTAMGSLTLTAYFTSNSPSQYTLTVTANDVSMGSVMGGGSYAAGSTATLAAIPRAGYHFTQWNDGNTDNPRTVTVTGNATYTAQFAANTSNYTITATTNDPTMGSVAGGGSYASGASVTLTAVPAPCHHFVAWSNGATTASITFTVTQDDALTATFVRDADQHSYTEVTHCGPYTWAVNGRTYNQSGIKTYRNTSAAGCVSRDTLSLTVVSRWTSHEYVTNCGPYTWNVNGRTYNQSGNKTYRSTAADGCPKYDTLTLTVVNRWTSHEYVTNCGPYTWDVNGRTYNQSGSKTYRSTAADGCPKYDTLTLTVVNRWSNHEYVTNCGPYTWDVNGRTYNQSGTKTYRSTAADGCPKYDTLTLTVVNRWSNHEYVTNCGPYTWDVNGRTYNQSGTKTYRSTAADGCPKYDTLTLVVGHDQSSHVYVTNCGPYTWAANGRTYNQSGTKTYKGTTPEGCVSRDTLTLTINNCGKNPETNSQLSTLNSQLSIYPNPTTGMVHIDATEVDRVEVLDLVGRRVVLFENTATLDLSNLAAGTYTLRVTLPDGVVVRKVVKK